MKYFYLLIIFFSLFSCKTKKEIVKSDNNIQITEKIISDYQNLADIIVSEINDNFLIVDKNINILITDYNDSNIVVKTTHITANEKKENKTVTDLTITDKSKSNIIIDDKIDVSIKNKTEIKEENKFIKFINKIIPKILILISIVILLLLLIKTHPYLKKPL